jgi:hypothetical protein
MIAFAWCHTALLHHKGGYLIWYTARQPLRELLLYWVIQAKETTSCAPCWGIARYTAPISLRRTNSSVGIPTGYGLDGRGSIPKREKIFLFSSVQTGSGTHPASYPMDPGGFIAGVKRLGREADHSPPSNAEVKNCVAIPPLPHTSSCCGA